MYGRVSVCESSAYTLYLWRISLHLSLLVFVFVGLYLYNCIGTQISRADDMKNVFPTPLHVLHRDLNLAKNPSGF